MDDMDLCPHSPGYARSSDMYTHMGTMPRPSLKKKEKSFKGSKKAKGKTELSRKESQRQAADYVRESPLLMALNTQGMQNYESPPRPPTTPDGPLPSEPTEMPSAGLDLETDSPAEKQVALKQSQTPPNPDHPRERKLPGKHPQPRPTAPIALTSHPNSGKAQSELCPSQRPSEHPPGGSQPAMPPKTTCPGQREGERSEVVKQQDEDLKTKPDTR